MKLYMSENGSSHLERFAEHVFSFLTPKQVEDHLLTIQPPQCSEVSGKHTQSHNMHRLVVNQYMFVFPF